MDEETKIPAVENESEEMDSMVPAEEKMSEDEMSEETTSTEESTEDEVVADDAAM